MGRDLNRQKHVAGDGNRRSSLSRVVQESIRLALRKQYRTLRWSDTWLSEVCIAFAYIA